MRVLFALLFFLSFVLSSAHPTGKAKGPSKAAPQLAQAAKELDAYKKELVNSGKYGCCIKAPKTSKVDGCNMCAAKNGSCACASNLAKGLGTCGECKGGWVSGRGAFSLADFGLKDASSIPVLSAEKQKMAGVEQNLLNPHLTQYQKLMLAAKKILVSEKRFSCCVGQGGCDECALEGYCGCAVNLASDMGKKAGEKKEGICSQCLDGQHGGHGRVPGMDPHDMTLMPDMPMGMKGVIASSMNQEGSGTSWLPASSPMSMLMLPKSGRYDLQFMGIGSINYADTGGKRGESQLFSNSMAMVMAQRETGGGTLGLRAMASLDAVTNGKKGYPNLFQTGETAGGLPLKDRQHPHDLIMELSVTYSRSLGGGVNGFLYLAPVGEPALGTAAFQHRPSGWENPEAPIGHHWNDGTHISYGVVTGGLTLGDRWKLDVSAFNGREPDENRYDIDRLRLDSYSGRLTFNPSGGWSLSGSYGFSNSPEILEPGEDQHRAVLSAFHNSSFRGGNLAFGAIWGRIIKHDSHTDSLTLEGTWSRGGDAMFARFERAHKDELVDVPAGRYGVSKFTIGGVKELGTSSAFTYGLGGYIGVYSVPSSLDSIYGKQPVSFGVFLRIRPR